MKAAVALFLSIWLKFFFVFTPFFALSMFLSMTENHHKTEKQKIAISVSLAVAVICTFLLFAGNQLFTLLGITLNSFRIGAGILLFISAVYLVHGNTTQNAGAGTDIAVVPLAIPIIVGPATTGTLLVLGAELGTLTEKITGFIAMMVAVVSLGLVLLSSSVIHKYLGNKGISILSKLTGLVLAALASQMVMTGITGFLGRQN